ARASEAHHFGYTANAKRIFGGGMFTNQIFIYDLEPDPRRPKLVRTVDLDPTGYSGPHTLYALPDGVLISMLGSVGGGTPGGLVKLDDDGNLLETYPSRKGDGPPVFMYDVGVKPELNRMITSSWAPPAHVKGHTQDPSLVGDEVVVWDFEKKKPLQVEHLDLAPLEVRWLHGPAGLGGYINCMLGNSIWHWEDRDRDGRLEFTRVLELGEGAAPADIRISYDNRFLFVSLWGGDRVQQYDIRDRSHPVFVSEVELPQPNMMKLSPDSRRLYVTNSILSRFDGDVEFGAWLLRVTAEGITVDPAFAPDFNNFPAGPAGPHDMLLK
ncbi:MAG TPA: selenium-binding protein SBP56-related protein, partial [Gemmatimonadales bacterium]|nr:selenium-binding protein SBP56-related protein [Gemmatimonadales bacterium]